MNMEASVKAIQGDQRIIKRFEEAMKMTGLVTAAAVSSVSTARDALYIAIGAVLGSAQITAALVSKGQKHVDGETVSITEKGITNETFTLALCLVLSCTTFDDPEAMKEGANSTVDYGPEKYREALALYTKITGKDDYSMFPKGLVEGAKKAEKALN